jgi:hypothetical protein
MYAVKEFADSNKLTALVLHHTRKTVGKDKDRDIMEDVSGTQGLAGGCDGVLVLKRARQSNDAVLSVTGRDDAEKELALHFDPETLTWVSLGTAEEHQLGENQKRILAFMESRSGSPVFVSEMSDLLGVEDGSVRKALHRLLERGLVSRRGTAWVHPGQEPGGVSAAF